MGRTEDMLWSMEKSAHIEHAGPDREHGDAPEDGVVGGTVHEFVPCVLEADGVENFWALVGCSADEIGEFAAGAPHPQFFGCGKAELVAASHDGRRDDVAQRRFEDALGHAAHEIGHLLAAEHGRIGERYILGHENLSLGHLLAELQRLTGLSMPRHRVPYWLAYVSALVSEGMANITKKPPMAPLTGVRLARSSMAFDCSKARTELNWQCRPLEQSLRDTIADLQQRGLLRRDPGLAVR